MAEKEKKVIGLIETVTLRGSRGQREVEAKIDTGASRTTVDTEIAAEIGLGPIVDTVKIVTSSADASEKRPIVEAHVTLAGEEFDVVVAIGDRANMKYASIVGRDILTKSKFLIDPTKGLDDED